MKSPVNLKSPEFFMRIICTHVKRGSGKLKSVFKKRPPTNLFFYTSTVSFASPRRWRQRLDPINNLLRESKQWKNTRFFPGNWKTDNTGHMFRPRNQESPKRPKDEKEGSGNKKILPKLNLAELLKTHCILLFRNLIFRVLTKQGRLKVCH